MADKLEADYSETRRKIHVLNGEMAALLEEQGDALAKRMGYDGLRGMDALHRFLIDKHHWLPHQVRSLTVDELKLLLAGVKELEKPPRPRAGTSHSTSEFTG